MTRRRFRIPGIVLALSLLATALATAFALRSTQSRDLSRFQNAVENSWGAIETRLEIYTNMLRAGSGLFAADKDVTPEEFHAYVERLDLQRRYPGIQGIGFSAHVPRSQIGPLIEQMHARGVEDFRLWPESEEPFVDAILYLEPLDERNRAAIGFNMASEPTRREAMLRARDTARSAASGLVTLVQEIDEKKQPGFLICVPVYSTTRPPGTVAERRRQLRGFIYGAFRTGDLFRGIFGEVREPQVDFEIYDRAVAPERLLYDSATAVDGESGSRYSTTRKLDVAGREWILRFETRPEFEAASSRNQAWLILVGGLLFSAALFWMSRRQARARAEAISLYEEAQEHRRAAEAASRTKDDFLATISHEIRTPMTSILGWSSLLAQKGLPPDEADAAIESIHRSSRVQAELIDDLLDLSRISSGKLDISPAPTDLNEVVRDAVHSVRQDAEKKGLDLQTELPDKTALVWGDPKRLHQIVSNLLTNAVKFTEAGSVRASVLPASETVTIEIADTGAGIDPAFVPHLFERFRQADTTATRPYGGLGIGLSIVRHLTELHGGHVEAESEGPGKGTTFRVTLPCIPEDETPSAHSAQPNGSIAGLRILVVEDEPAVREFLAAVLRHAGSQIRQARNVEEAMKELEKRPFDLIVSDIAMPGEDGCTMMERIRRLPDRPLASIPALAITAYGRSAEKARIRECGFNSVIQKPVEASRLVASIATLAREHGVAAPES